VAVQVSLPSISSATTTTTTSQPASQLWVAYFYLFPRSEK
jgi:hypothetical protein